LPFTEGKRIFYDRSKTAAISYYLNRYKTISKNMHNTEVYYTSLIIHLYYTVKINFDVDRLS